MKKSYHSSAEPTADASSTLRCAASMVPSPVVIVGAVVSVRNPLNPRRTQRTRRNAGSTFETQELTATVLSSKRAAAASQAAALPEFAFLFFLCVLRGKSTLYAPLTGCAAQVSAVRSSSLTPARPSKARLTSISLRKISSALRTPAPPFGGEAIEERPADHARSGAQRHGLSTSLPRRTPPSRITSTRLPPRPRHRAVQRSQKAHRRAGVRRGWRR